MEIKTIQKYIAFDDTEFDTQNECIEYEEINLIRNSNDIICLDNDLKIIKSNNTKAYVYASFIYLGSQNAVALFKSACDYYGIEIQGLRSTGYYQYNYGGDYWGNIDTIMSQYQDIKDALDNERQQDVN